MESIGQIIRRKIQEEQQLSVAEKRYVESLLPKFTQMYRFKAYLYVVNKKRRYFMHIFESKRQAEGFFKEKQESQLLSQKLGRYLMKLVDNLVFTVVRGKTMQTMKEFIKNEIQCRPLCTAVFDGENFVLKTVLKREFSVELHWEREDEAPVLVPDPEILHQSEQVKFKNEVDMISMSEYHQRRKQKTTIILDDQPLKQKKAQTTVKCWSEEICID